MESFLLRFLDTGDECQVRQEITIKLKSGENVLNYAYNSKLYILERRRLRDDIGSCQRFENFF